MKRRLLIVFVMAIAVPWMLSAQFVLKKELNALRGGDVYSTPSPVDDIFYIPGPDTIRASAVEEGELLTGTEHY